MSVSSNSVAILLPHIAAKCDNPGQWMNAIAKTRGVSEGTSSLLIIKDFMELVCQSLNGIAKLPVAAVGSDFNSILVSDLKNLEENWREALDIINVFKMTCRMGEIRFSVGEMPAISKINSNNLNFLQAYNGAWGLYQGNIVEYIHPNMPEHIPFDLDNVDSLIISLNQEICDALVNDKIVTAEDLQSNILSQAYIHKETTDYFGRSIYKVEKVDYSSHIEFLNMISRLENLYYNYYNFDYFSHREEFCKNFVYILNKYYSSTSSKILYDSNILVKKFKDVILHDSDNIVYILDHFKDRHMSNAIFNTNTIKLHFLDARIIIKLTNNGVEVKDIIKVLHTHNINELEVKSLVKDVLSHNINENSAGLAGELINSFKDSFSQNEYENFRAVSFKRQNAEDLYSIMKCENSFSDCSKLKEEIIDFYYSAPKEVKQILDIATKSYLNTPSYGIKIGFYAEDAAKGAVAFYTFGRDVYLRAFDKLNTVFFAAIVHEMSHRAVHKIWDNYPNPFSGIEERAVYRKAMEENFFFKCQNENALELFMCTIKEGGFSQFVKTIFQFDMVMDTTFSIAYLYDVEHYEAEYVVRYYQNLIQNGPMAHSFYSMIKDYHYNYLIPKAVERGLLSNDTLSYYNHIALASKATYTATGNFMGWMDNSPSLDQNILENMYEFIIGQTNTFFQHSEL
ncbi:hypothetical protein NOVO_01225 [Rickettsiales bacterium Ac37b]|nr:hypothetical protein NOVO_01225 [Rickettsiales bacterium Ac37b]